MCLCLCLGAFGACATASDEEGLMLYLAFDERSGSTAVDGSGNYADAPVEFYLKSAVYKEPEDVRRRPGVKDKALWFDGWSSYIAYDDFAAVGDLAISMWVAPRSFEYPDGGVSALVSKYSSSQQAGYLLGITDYGSWTFRLGLEGLGWVTLDDADNKLSRFEWAHIAATYDKESGVMALYKNGQIVNSRQLAKGHAIKDTTESLLIGKNGNGRTDEAGFSLGMYCGLMDELKIYGRALGAADVRAQFDAGTRGGKVPVCTWEDISHEAGLLADDKYMPQYHTAPSAGWMNEPIAPFVYKGVWHMFYQSTASGPYWRYTQWAHWVSDDKAHWREMPPIMFPEPDGFADHHVFSGNALLDASGLPYIFYTGVNFALPTLNRISYATPKDPADKYLTEWTRSAQPLFTQPADCSQVDFRDPFIYREGNEAFMVIATSSATTNFRDGNPRTVVYKADLSDLTDWKYLGVMYEASYAKYKYLGYCWELPVLTKLTSADGMWEKYALFVSPKPDAVTGTSAAVYYWLGEFDTSTGKFKPEQSEPTRFDYGNSVPVITDLIDYETGENTVYGLMNGGQTTAQVKLSGWTNYVTLGKNIGLDPTDGTLRVGFDKVYEKLHKKELVGVSGTDVAAANEKLKKASGDMLHIKLTVRTNGASEFGLKLRKSATNEFGQYEETVVSYLDSTDSVWVDTTNSSIADEGGMSGGKLGKGGGTVELEIYLDRSSIEVIANNSKCITSSLRPTFADADKLELYAEGGSAEIVALTVWSMQGTR